MVQLSLMGCVLYCRPLLFSIVLQRRITLTEEVSVWYIQCMAYVTAMGEAFPSGCHSTNYRLNPVRDYRPKSKSKFVFSLIKHHSSTRYGGVKV
jgi:hypothetical protein